jgi:hypothetical protein
VEGDQVRTQRIEAMVLVLGMATLGGCGERRVVRPTAEATPPAAPSAPVPAPAAATACGSTCPVPAPSAPVPAALEPRRASLGADDRLVVKRFVLARGVKDREPVNAGTTFKADDHKVYAFVEIENKGSAPAEVVVEFEPPGGGAPHGDVTLAVRV